MQRDEDRHRALCDACRDAAREAATFIATRATDTQAIDWQVKSRADYVSEVDHGAEMRIAERLLSHFPGATIVGEELSPAAPLGAGLAFIVDPLDGTTNFLHGYPQYAVSIAATEDGWPVAGVIHDVARNVVYRAIRGAGAFRGDTPIRVSLETQPIRSLVATGFPFKDQSHVASYLPQLERMLATTAGVRRAGSAALDLADVACGRVEGYWELMLAPWDMAAGILLVREAGGVVTDCAGRPLEPAHSSVLATNGVMHPWFLETLGTNAGAGRAVEPTPTYTITP